MKQRRCKRILGKRGIRKEDKEKEIHKKKSINSLKYDSRLP